MTDREEWHNAYVEELKDMYNIMMTDLTDKFPHTEINIEKHSMISRD